MKTINTNVSSGIVIPHFNEAKDAIRELFFNACDADKDWSHSINDGVLVIQNATEETVNWEKVCVVGYSNKTNEQIGVYGEGFHLALTFLLRKGYAIKIETESDVITPTFQNNEADIETLQLQLEPKPLSADLKDKPFVKLTIEFLEADDIPETLGVNQAQSTAYVFNVHGFYLNGIELPIHVANYGTKIGLNFRSQDVKFRNRDRTEILSIQNLHKIELNRENIMPLLRLWKRLPVSVKTLATAGCLANFPTILVPSYHSLDVEFTNGELTTVEIPEELFTYLTDRDIQTGLWVMPKEIRRETIGLLAECSPFFPGDELTLTEIQSLCRYSQSGAYMREICIQPNTTPEKEVESFKRGLRYFIECRFREHLSEVL